MKFNSLTLIIIFAFLCFNSNAQTHENAELKKIISSIIAGKKADIAVSIVGLDKDEHTAINGNKMYPMLSTFKFPIALTILHKIEQGQLSLNQKIFIKKEELIEDTYSPFRKKYPKGNISITIEKAMQWMVSYSDNNLTDILLRLIGGTQAVQEFMDSDEHFIIKNNEEQMHANWESQFVNQTTPNNMISVLQEFYNGNILNKKHTQWLYKAMLNNKTGLKRLRGNLPVSVKIANRTGTSFTNKEGMTGAINDFGIVELPDKKKIFIAVFIRDSFETFDNSEKIIADISKATYDYYSGKK